MNIQQQHAVIDAAKHKTGGADEDIEIDAQAGDPTGFDETEDGVWVRAWVWVSKESIPGYQMTPPSPPAEVVVPMAYLEFRTAYIAAYTGAGDSWTVENLRASWEAYQRNPAGHFISKVKP